jgi:hypothetical protein
MQVVIALCFKRIEAGGNGKLAERAKKTLVLPL